MQNLMRAFIRVLFGQQPDVPAQRSPATDAVPATPTIALQALPSLATRSAQPTGETLMTERDIRAAILNSFLSTPHGKLAELVSLHISALERDPLFYGHLAVWYAECGAVRDHQVLFVAHLLTSDFAELRETGWVLLQKLPPHLIASAFDSKRVIGKTPRMCKSAVMSYLRALEGNV